MRIIFFLFSFSLMAQVKLNEVRVSESFFASDLEDSFASYDIIDGDDIDKKFQGDALKALQSISSIYVTQNGLLGQQASVFLRGNSSSRILVLVDGVEMNDPTETSNGFVMENLSGLDIETIEVLKGAQSGVYGADAVAGIINIVTKKTYQNQNKLIVGGGNYGQQRIALTNEKKFDASWIKASFDYQKQDGLSAALGGDEKDSASKSDMQLRYGRGAYNGFFKFLNLNSDIDRGAFKSKDDPNYVADLNTFTLSNQFDFKRSHTQSKLQIDFNKFDRNYTNRPDSNDSTNQVYQYTGHSSKTRFSQKRKQESLTYIIGGEFEHNKMESEFTGDYQVAKKTREINSVAVFNEYRFSLIPTIKHDLALRYDQFSNDNERLTFRFYNKFLVDKSFHYHLKLASAFKNPSLDQLYNPDYGNENLKSETSKDIELGMQYGEGARLFELMLFYQRIENLIDFDSGYINRGNARFYGAESKVSYAHSGHFFDLSHTHLKATTKGARISGRPENKWSFAYRFKNLQANLIYVGERKTLPNYSVLDLNYTWDHKQNKWNLKIGNIFDRDFQDVAGYSTMGRNISLNFTKKYSY